MANTDRGIRYSQVNQEDFEKYLLRKIDLNPEYLLMANDIGEITSSAYKASSLAILTKLSESISDDDRFGNAILKDFTTIINSENLNSDDYLPTVSAVTTYTSEVIAKLKHFTVKTTNDNNTSNSIVAEYYPDINNNLEFKLGTFKGATENLAGFNGLVPAPAKGSSNRYLSADGTFKQLTMAEINIDGFEFPSKDIEVFTGATASAEGKQGLVPKPVAGDNKKYLSGDGTFKKIPMSEIDTSGYSFGESDPFTGATESANGTKGLVPAPSQGFSNRYLSADGTFKQLTMAEINIDGFDFPGGGDVPVFKGTNGIANGTKGLVPAPTTDDVGKYLSSNGTFKKIPMSEIDTTGYDFGSSEVFTGATASAEGKQGLVPKPVAGDNKKYLSGDGTFKELDFSGQKFALAVRNAALNQNLNVLYGDAYSVTDKYTVTKELKELTNNSVTFKVLAITITFATALPVSNYALSIQPAALTGSDTEIASIIGSFGEYVIGNKTTTGFTVYFSGTALDNLTTEISGNNTCSANFDWILTYIK